MSKLQISTYNRLERHTLRTFEEVSGYLSKGPHTKPLTNVNLEILIKAYEHFNTTILEYYNSIPDDVTEQDIVTLDDKVRSQYSTLFKQLKILVPTEVDQTPICSTRLSLDNPNLNDTTLFYLPKMELPKFSGLFPDWDNFYSQFKSLVHDNSSLSDLQKYQFLQRSLDKNSLSLISHLPLSEINYSIALQILTDRFVHPALKIALHCNHIISLPPVQENDSVALRNFIDQYQSNFNALHSLQANTTVSPLDSIVASLLLSKMSKSLKLKFETKGTQDTSFPTVQSILEFLRHRAIQLENVQILHINESIFPCTSTPKAKAVKRTPSLVSTPLTTNSSCFCCTSPQHSIYKCSIFLAKSPKERFNTISQLKLCTNCLRPHLTSQCPSHIYCRSCGMKHHSLLHFDSSSSRQIERAVQSNPPSVSPNPALNATSGNASPVLTSSPLITSNPILLSTCLVKLQTDSTNYVIVRAILDSASASSFVCESVIHSLKIKRNAVPVPLSGIGNTPVSGRGFASLNIFSLFDTQVASDYSFIILPKITTNTPSLPLPPTVRNSFNSFILADPSFDSPGPVSCLLGADIFSSVITGAPIHIGPNLPYALPTTFGSVIMGKVVTEPFESLPALVATGGYGCVLSPPPFLVNYNPLVPPPPMAHPLVTLTCSLDLQASLQRFWELEQPPVTPPKDPLGQQCEDYFIKTTSQDHTGRFTVRLPFASNAPLLGTSYNQALKRFNSLERKFKSNPQFQVKYVEFMTDYLQKSHMVPLSSSEQPLYFIPHHGIFKSHGDSSKLRVVFDASAKTSSGVSLNDILLSGPKLQSSIADVLTLFRIFKYVFTCDVEQMFRQVSLHPEDQLYQCILWRPNATADLKLYKLTTVTYGLTSSPFLAIRTLKELALNFKSRFPLAAELILNQSFVDDISGGADTLDKALAIQAELISLLSLGGFSLKKWTANHADLLNHLPLTDLDPSLTLNPPLLKTSVLGLHWDPPTDNFNFSPLEPPSEDFSITKRFCLSLVARLYDPCGWVAPTIINAKVFLQNLWLQALGWDDPLPPALLDQWQGLLHDFKTLSLISIPRLMIPHYSEAIQIFGFSDACKQAYAAVIYIAIVNSSQPPILICSKTRVSPLKVLTIPRLELMGALLLAQLGSHFVSLLSPYFSEVHPYWFSDSTIVLSWISTSSHRLKTFVANRVASIQELTSPSSWSHVTTHDNPADLACRGVSPPMLSQNSLWWHGPDWLSRPELHPSRLPPPPDTTAVEAEVLNTPVPTLTVITQGDLIPRLSSWSTIVRVIRYVLSWSPRFKNNFPSAQLAIIAISYFIQTSSLSDLYLALSSNRNIPKPFRKLAPFLGPSGVILVGGRMPSVSTPILLPKRHRLVDLLIDHAHVSLAHSGPHAVHAHLASRYWIISGRQAIKSRIHKCISCFRASPVSKAPLMGDLPHLRVSPALPFVNTGMDYAGPFLVKLHHLRKASVVKVYWALFICFTTRAIHLEVAEDLSTDAFLDALRRFISRRGLPNQLFSDCGTNFIGAESCLRRQWRKVLDHPSTSPALHAFLSDHNITFNFLPPNAPHQGGLWERAVRSAKFHLKRVLGQQTPSLSNFISLTTRIEGALNSRPLSSMSSDPNDLEVLTPAHFLIGRPLLTPPDAREILPSLPPYKHFSWVQAHLAHFWSRWSVEVLLALNQIRKWDTPTANLRVGDLVLLQEQNSPPLCWPRGRIVEVFPGTRGAVRKVAVHTASGTYVRPAVRVFPLPLRDSFC